MTAGLHRFDNGVRLVCDGMDGLESLAISVVIRGGARWESAACNGWSHLLEHMVFKGAGDRSAREIVEAVEQQGGSINAATGYERTSFQIRCLKGGLPLAMEILSDLVRRPKMDARDLEREKSVIGQEIAEAVDTPDDHVFDLAQTQAFGQDAAMGRHILGSAESIGAATPQTLSRYHSGLYASDRMIVSVAGAVDQNELLALAERHFGGGAAATPANPSALEPTPARFLGGAVMEARKLEQAHLVMLLPGVGARDHDYFVMRLFAEALGGGMSSRLFQEAREQRGLAYAIDAYAESYEDVGLLGVYAGTSGLDAAQTARLAVEQIKALTQAPQPGELARAKAQLKAHLFMARESPLARAEQAAGQLFLFDRLFTTSELAEAIDAVEATDFGRLGERVLGGASAIAVLGPKRAGAAAEAFAQALAA